MKSNKRFCKLCDDEILIFDNGIGCNGNLGKGRRESHIDSDEGVSIIKGVWFCNECWAEIINSAQIRDLFNRLKEAE